MAKNENLEKAARFLATYLGSLDETYKDRLEILKSERSFTDLQAIGSIVCYALDHGQHLLVSSHPFFESEPVGGTGEAAICECGKPFKTDYPGMKFCGNICAIKYRSVVK